MKHQSLFTVQFHGATDIAVGFVYSGLQLCGKYDNFFLFFAHHPVQPGTYRAQSGYRLFLVKQ